MGVFGLSSLFKEKRSRLAFQGPTILAEKPSFAKKKRGAPLGHAAERGEGGEGGGLQQRVLEAVGLQIAANSVSPGSICERRGIEFSMPTP